jgi:hypothetical protein
MPPFREELINDAFGQDDLYVEMTFLRSLEQYGWDVPLRQAGLDFANSKYALWVANDAGRRNLRNGIAPPDSSHPQFHNCAGAIDYQIEADFAGLICPGMPDQVIALGEKFGRLMNYGDGVYAGQFIGTLYAEAFFETDIAKLIEAGLKAIPSQCLYAEMVRDLVRWHQENPEDWAKTWDLVVKKYRQDRNYYISALDVKLEAAFVLMGLLYGKGDLDQTMIISCRCGSDSDCNPSSSGGILFTTRGMKNLPDRYYKKLNEKGVFSYTAYTFPGLIEVSEKLARQAVVKAGGRLEKNAAGEEVFLIPIKATTPSRFEDLKHPGPVADSRFTDAEMARIESPGLQWAMKQLDGWQLANADPNRGSMFWEWQGKKKVFVLNGLARGAKAYALTKSVTVSAGKTALALAARCDPKAEGWNIVVKADGKELVKQAVTQTTMDGGWTAVSAALPDAANATVAVEITMEPPALPAERRGPPALYFTCPEVGGR